MVVHFDVVIHLHPGFVPFGVFVGSGRQRQGIGPVNRFEKLPARFLELFQGTVIETLQALADGGVELAQAEESAMSQYRQYPSLGDEHTIFHGRLVRGFTWTRRQHRAAVVLRHIRVSRIQVRLVLAGFADAALEIIRHQHPGSAAEILQRPPVGADPVRQCLRQRGFGVGIVGSAPDGQE